jgi:hypothetical protein
MFDTALNDQFPGGAVAYAAYVDGDIGNQPNYAYIVTAFPQAQHLSIALFATDNADVLDVEAGASAPSDIPGWYATQVQRGIQRPVVYANVSTMNDAVLPVLSQAGIARAQIRLWTAHYGEGKHICGPDTCGALSINADGTQWTSNAMGLILDQSLLLDTFFTVTTDPTTTHRTITEAELQSGQLNNGKGAVTAIAVPPGTAVRIVFGVDNALQNQPVAQLRVAIFDTAWRIHPQFAVDGTKGLAVVPFPDPAKTGVISIRRMDNGLVSVGYVVYLAFSERPRQAQRPRKPSSQLRCGVRGRACVAQNISAALRCTSAPSRRGREARPRCSCSRCHAPSGRP